VLALPINQVAGGTYAELKDDRERLSKAFFRVNAFLVRSGFLVAGVLAAVAPEFVRVILGEKWLPMLGSFRLMLVFTLLDPIRVTISSLFVALGRPGDVVRSRLIQLLVMVPSVAVLGTWLGIEGVALATNGVLLVGMVILLVQAKLYVDFSVRRLFLVPCAGIGLGLLASYLLSRSTWIAAGRLAAGVGRGLACALVYVAVLAVCEGGSFKAMLGPFRRALACKKR